MSNHTPGPWTVDPEGEHAVEVEGATGTVVCTVYQPANDAPDARLIAAAPDMLEALRHAHTSLRTFSDSVPQSEQMWTTLDADTLEMIGRLITSLEGGDG